MKPVCACLVPLHTQSVHQAPSSCSCTHLSIEGHFRGHQDLPCLQLFWDSELWLPVASKAISGGWGRTCRPYPTCCNPDAALGPKGPGCSCPWERVSAPATFPLSYCLTQTHFFLCARQSKGVHQLSARWPIGHLLTWAPSMEMLISDLPKDASCGIKGSSHPLGSSYRISVTGVLTLTLCQLSQ